MPKKFPSENSKAAAARARKNERAQEEKERKDKELEDAKWKDDDKQLSRKLARKEEAERKRIENLAKKKERALLAEEEEKSSGDSKKGPNVKITQAHIREEKERRDAIARASAKGEQTHIEKPIEENINVKMADEVQARNLDEAISALSVKSTLDKHPEKRMKAAYEEFESERLPQLKTEFSNLRLSQLKQMLRKEWMKHPNNPLNQRIQAYNNK